MRVWTVRSCHSSDASPTPVSPVSVVRRRNRQFRSPALVRTVSSRVIFIGGGIPVHPCGPLRGQATLSPDPHKQVFPGRTMSTTLGAGSAAAAALVLWAALHAASGGPAGKDRR